jgi:hypothetical protein
MSDRTAVETIQAAIEKLEELKALSTGPNLWMVDREFPAKVLHPDKPGYDWDGQLVADTNTDEIGLPTNPADARLIVTLHRTIDAQLAILANGLIVAKHWEDILEQVSGTMRTPINHALLLARAILGEES